MYLCQVIIFLVAVGIYWNSLSGDFVHDDIVAIVRNPDVNYKQRVQNSLESGESGNGDWGSLWKNDYWGMPMASPVSHKSYRPITVLTFRLNYYFGGEVLCAEIFHATNVLIHALVCCLLFYVCRGILRLNVKSSLLASILFAAHPIHTEAVAGITGRADALACLLMLASFICYHGPYPSNLTASDSTKCQQQKYSRDKNHNEFGSFCENLNKESGISFQHFQSLEYPTMQVCKCQHRKDNEEQKVLNPSCSETLKNILKVIVSGILSLMSMLAKETGITISAINILYDLYTFQNIHIQQKENQCAIVSENQKKSESSTKFYKNQVFHLRVRLLSTTVLAIVGILSRLYLMNGEFPRFGKADNPAAYSDSVLTKLLTFTYLPALNLWLILCPITLSYDWQMGSVPLVESIWEPRNIVSFLFYTVLLLLVVKVVKSSDHKSGKVLCFSLLFTTLPFVPASNLFFPVGFVVAERILYAPSVGVCILIAYGVQCFEYKGRKLVSQDYLKVFTRAGVFILVLSLSLRTWQRNMVWQSRQSLFTSGIFDVPQNAKVHYNYANLQKNIGNYTQAIDHYQISIRLWPEYASAHNNLGTLLMADLEQAKYQFVRALTISNQAHGGAHFNLGVVYMKQEKFLRAATHFKKSLIVDPSHPQALHYLDTCAGEVRKQQSLQQGKQTKNTNIETANFYDFPHTPRKVAPRLFSAKSSCVSYSQKFNRTCMQTLMFSFKNDSWYLFKSFQKPVFSPCLTNVS